MNILVCLSGEIQNAFDCEDKEMLNEISDLTESDTLLREILYNPRTSGQVSKIRDELKDLLHIIDNKDEQALNEYLKRIREHIK